MVRRPGLWRASGMSGQRLDRAELRHRLPAVQDWIIDDLADAFEPALLTGLRTAADRNRAARPDAPADTPKPRRARRGRPLSNDPHTDQGGDT